VKRRAAGRAGRGADPRFIVLTGLSGSGKSQAIRALEDLGYFCVDNLPTVLIPTLAQLARRAGPEIAKTAVVVDIRESTFPDEFPAVYRKLRSTKRLTPLLIFLEATDAALVRRFSETRRPHPLAHDRSAIEGIREERARLAPIRRMAHEVIDTSDMTVHELRRVFMSVSRGKTDQPRLVVTLLSFGFKHGLPLDSDLVFDVRFLPNPHFVARLRKYSGKDRPVRRFLDKYAATREFEDRVADLLSFLLPQYVAEGKSYLTVAIGCTGGRHRSVAVAEDLRGRLTASRDIQLRVKHRDIANE
jgi:UPF0042 nucleotide-binding protein